MCTCKYANYFSLGADCSQSNIENWGTDLSKVPIFCFVYCVSNQKRILLGNW